MAPTPVSAAVPQIEQHILRADNEYVVKEHQFSTQLLKLMKANAELGADDAALINGDNGKALTYRQFLEQAVKTAQGMRNLGLVPGDAITLMSRNSAYAVTTSVSSYLAGVMLHPMFPYLEPKLVVEQLHIVRPRIVFTEAFALDRIRAGVQTMSPKPRIVVLDSENVEPGMMTMDEFLRLGSNADVGAFEEAYIENPDEEKALIIFTTGSTGPPKPVIHSVGSIQAGMMLSRNLYHSQGNALSLPFVSWITGQCAFLVAVCDRITVVYSTEMTLDKQEKFLKEYQITTYVGSPFTALQLSLRGPFPSTVKRVIVGGSPMRMCTEAAIRNALAPDASIMPIYGSTETAIIFAVDYGKDRENTVGRLRVGVETQVRDIRTGRPLPANQRGEIVARTPALMKCYLNRPEQTREVVDEQGWIKTGDFGYYDEDGYLFVLDRIKDVVHYKDHVVLPSELTDKIGQHPDVMDSAVCGVSHPEDNQHPVAFVSVKPGKSITEEELNKHVEKLCGNSYKLRGGVYFLERIPRTLSGKVATIDLQAKLKQIVETGA